MHCTALLTHSTHCSPHYHHTYYLRATYHHKAPPPLELLYTPCLLAAGTFGNAMGDEDSLGQHSGLHDSMVKVPPWQCPSPAAAPHQAATGSSALPKRGPATGRPATASGVRRAIDLQTRQLFAFDHSGTATSTVQ